MTRLTLNLNTRRHDGELLVDIVVGNPSTERAVVIGNLNLANLKMCQVNEPGRSASPWMSVHNPNTAGIETIAPGEFLAYDALEILREYRFPGPGEYRAWVIYDTLGFPEHFADAPEDGLLTKALAQVDEVRMFCDEIRFTLTDSDYEFNVAHVRRWVEQPDGRLVLR